MHIGIVVAGDDADELRLTKAGEPVRGSDELRRQRNVGDIAGDDHMVRMLQQEILGERIQYRSAVNMLPAEAPGEESPESLAGKVAQAKPKLAGHVRIGKVGKKEHTRSALATRQGAHAFAEAKPGQPERLPCTLTAPCACTQL